MHLPHKHYITCVNVQECATVLSNSGHTDPISQLVRGTALPLMQSRCCARCGQGISKSGVGEWELFQALVANLTSLAQVVEENKWQLCASEKAAQQAGALPDSRRRP